MLAISVTEGAALLILGLLVIGLLRSHADILRALHELGAGQGDERDARRSGRSGAGQSTDQVGRASSDLQGKTLDGETVAIGVAGTGHDTLLAFLSAGCYTCEPFWSALSAGAEVPNQARVIAVVQAADQTSKLRMIAGNELLVVVSDTAWLDYEVPGSPHFVYVDGPSGVVTGEGTASTWPQVIDLLRHSQDPTRPTRPGRRPSEASDRDNATRIDLELQSAGIGAGHASLYPDASAAESVGPLHADPP
jgi:hypothetical protein